VKRWILIILLFLFLGAIVNAAVAWACAMWSEQSPPAPVAPQRAAEECERCGLEPFRDSNGFPAVSGATAMGLGFKLTAIHGLTLKPGGGYEAAYLCIHAAGLPFASMEGYMSGRAKDDIREKSWLIDPPPGMPPGPHVTKMLPLRPMWPEFLFAIVLYGAALWLLARMPVMWWRLHRVNSGRCPRCGYDLRACSSWGCPECGWGKRPEAAK